MNATHETNGRSSAEDTTGQPQNISRELHVAELHLAAQVDAASAQVAAICSAGGALDRAVGRYAHEITSAQQRLATMARAVHLVAGSLLSSLTGTLEGLQGMFAPFEQPEPAPALGRAAPRFPATLLPIDTMGPEEQQEFADDSPPWGRDGLPEDLPSTLIPHPSSLPEDEPDANTPPPADEPAPVPAPEEAKEEQEHTFTESQKDSVSRAFEDLEEPGPHGGDHEDEVKHEVEAIDRDEAVREEAPEGASGAAYLAQAMQEAQQPAQKKARKRKQR